VRSEQARERLCAKERPLATEVAAELHGIDRETLVLARLSNSTYVVHVYEVRSLRRVVEERVILLDEALADRLVRHVHRHGCDQ